MFKRKNFEMGVVDGLNFKNLPWNSDRLGQITETKHMIIRKDDPACTWYRPRTVTLLESNVWSLKRYLHDQETYPQYTHDDMMVKLGYPIASLAQLFRNNQSHCITPVRKPTAYREWKKLFPCPKILSPIPLNQTAEDVLWPNLHVCTSYKRITYVADELSNDTMSPYIMLIRSGDFYDHTSSSIGVAYRKLEELRELDRQREITHREKEIRDKVYKKLLKSKQKDNANRLGMIVRLERTRTLLNCSMMNQLVMYRHWKVQRKEISLYGR